MTFEKQGKVSRPVAILITIMFVGVILVIIGAPYKANFTPKDLGVKNVKDTIPINNSETSPVQEATQKAVVKDTTPINNSGTLIVKGFYIGMNIDDAVKLLNGKYKDVFLPGGEYAILVRKGETPPTEKPINIKEAYGGGGAIYEFDHFVQFKNSVRTGDYSIVDSDVFGRVIRIYFTSDVVDKLFNVADMDTQSFAQTFISNYPIPELTPFIYNPYGNPEHNYNNALGYTSDKGFKVIITQGKSLIIEKVASAKERKFD